MFVFGGSGTSDKYNDVWRYRPSKDMWTWISGSNIPHDTGKYPAQKCQFYDTYYPCNRMENQTASSNDGCSKAFWSFGGWGGGGSTLSTNGILNDLWLFDTDNFKWSWISGTKQQDHPGVYGTKGLRAASNMPPGKEGHCMWIDKQNNLWVFGGWKTGYIESNDLWRFEPDTTCISKYDLFIVTHVKPPTDTVLCPGDSSVLNIGRHRSVSYTPSGSVFPDADSSVLHFAPIVTTSYKVYIREGGCTGENDTLNFTIHVTKQDTVKLVAPSPLIKCAGDSIRMLVKPAWNISLNPATDVKYKPNGGTEIVFYNRNTTTYQVRAESNVACNTGADSIQFTVVIDTSRPPRLLAVTDTFLCKGDTAVYQLDEKLAGFAISPRGYHSISKDSLSFRFYPPATTTYQLLGTKMATCGKVTDTLNFTIHRSPLTAAFDLSPKITDHNHAQFRIYNRSGGATRSNWYMNGSYWTSEANPSYSNSDTGKYCFTLVAYDDNNCIDTAVDCGEVIHTNIYVPTAFSPNGDNKNDFFHAVGYNVDIMELAIYNRYGQRVFVTFDGKQGWDGTFGGKPCDLGSYYYFIRYRILENQPKILKGDVSLIR
jgi:gliding motility-associated-like protein